MTRQASLLVAFLVATDSGREVQSLMLSVHKARCLPLALVPSILPSRIALHMLLWRFVWPKYVSLLDLILFNRAGLYCMISHTSLLLFFSFQLILPIRRRHHISRAFIFFSWAFDIVQASEPYMKMENM